MRPLPLPNGDGMDGPDFLDTDSDNDGIDDAIEGHDADHDESADTAASGADTTVMGLTTPSTQTPTRRFLHRSLERGAALSDLDGMPFQITETLTTMATVRTPRLSMDADAYMGPAEMPHDIDSDGKPNWYDADSDGDTASDRTEGAGGGNADGDGSLDYLDPTYRPGDSDDDGIADTLECPVPARCPDSDGDSRPDFEDVDDDGDGILSINETDGDSDADGIPNHLDLDSDGDGLPDLIENGGVSYDADRDGRVDAPADNDGDGLDAAFDSDDMNPDARHPRHDALNSDDEGNPDYLDLDADADGLLDVHEADGSLSDINGDGQIDSTRDSDLDGLVDEVDPDQGGTPHPLTDNDADGVADFQDIDSDDDLVSDAIEAHDTDANGRTNNPPRESTRTATASMTLMTATWVVCAVEPDNDAMASLIGGTLTMTATVSDRSRGCGR